MDLSRAAANQQHVRGCSYSCDGVPVALNPFVTSLQLTTYLVSIPTAHQTAVQALTL